jgi:hypothetical protein
LPDLRLYRASALAGLHRFLFPDVARMRVVSLIAPGTELPDSSLSQMVDWAMDHFAVDGTYVAQADGLDVDRLVAALDASARTGEPLAILTTSGALIRALDALRALDRAFRLPHGSRLMDTGGDKGAPRRLSRNGLLHAVWSAFAIPGYFVVNEYGMAELSSQYYDTSLSDRVGGRHAPRRKCGPHWARTRILDPITLTPAAPGEVGLLGPRRSRQRGKRHGHPLGGPGRRRRRRLRAPRPRPRRRGTRVLALRRPVGRGMTSPLPAGEAQGAALPKTSTAADVERALAALRVAQRSLAARRREEVVASLSATVDDWLRN